MRSGLLLVASGAVLLSFAAVFVKLVQVGPTAAGVYRMLVGAVVLTAIALARGRRPRWSRPAVAFAALAGLFFALDIVFWHQSIHYVGPGLATILANFQVFILGAVGVFWFREQAGWRIGLAIPLAIVGLFLLVGVDWSVLSREYRIGVFLGLLTAFAYAGYLLVLRESQGRAERLDAVVTLAVVCWIATLLLGGTALAQGQSLAIPDVTTGGVLVAYGVVAQVVAWLLISRGLPAVTASRAGLMLLLQPGLAFMWDILFFGRPAGAYDLAGAAVVLAAIYLGTSRPPP